MHLTPEDSDFLRRSFFQLVKTPAGCVNESVWEHSRGSSGGFTVSERARCPLSVACGGTCRHEALVTSERGLSEWISVRPQCVTDTLTPVPRAALRPSDYPRHISSERAAPPIIRLTPFSDFDKVNIQPCRRTSISTAARLSARTNSAGMPHLSPSLARSPALSEVCYGICGNVRKERIL
ncbi:unnamed protein product [Pleuronectes platessa]|uniref:Uncharacterized protein n=1 Tax=Pleuronectes platessa TaxID=8262 RepID=A0A9N7USS9_PLEPL|nr:unnamed protein product [Pleuronectes platessa]